MCKKVKICRDRIIDVIAKCNKQCRNSEKEVLDYITSIVDVVLEKDEKNKCINEDFVDTSCIENIDISTILENVEDEYEVVDGWDNINDSEIKNEKEFAIINVPTTLIEDESFVGEFYADERDVKDSYYVFDSSTFDQTVESNEYNRIGIILPASIYKDIVDNSNNNVKFEGYDFFGAFCEGSWMFHMCDDNYTFMTCNKYTLVKELFSRNKGLFETSHMFNKTAIINACGSVGSLIALELARSGIGSFILVDGDVLGVHNICRHQLGFRDVGRYKVNALEDAIKNINPYAQVEKYIGYIQEAPFDMFKDVKNGIIISSCDNRGGNAIANDLAKVLSLPYVSVACWERASAGEIFYWIPNKDMVDYRKAFRSVITDERPETNAEYFGTSTEGKHIEVGTSCDLSFVTEVGMKVILDLFNMDDDNYTIRVLDRFTNYTLVCNTNKESVGGERATIFPYPCFVSNNVSLTGN